MPLFTAGKLGAECLTSPAQTQVLVADVHRLFIQSDTGALQRTVAWGQDCIGLPFTVVTVVSLAFFSVFSRLSVS